MKILISSGLNGCFQHLYEIKSRHDPLRGQLAGGVVTFLIEKGRVHEWGRAYGSRLGCK